MSQQQLLTRVVKALEAANVPYMLTGSIVSSFQGQPRATHDIDVVVQIRSDQVTAIATAFGGDNYAFDQVAAREAIARQDMFQLLEFDSGDKIDFWPLTRDDFDESRFARRRKEQIVGITAYLPTSEDTIPQKLIWATKNESEKHFCDALGVYELQFANLDHAYLNRWVQSLSLENIWKRITAEAQPLS